MTSARSDQFAVVKNIYRQYSIWPHGRELPAGWQTAGFEGSREECLGHIEQVWTDITPLTEPSSETGGHSE